jgi:hypothetical protein
MNIALKAILWKQFGAAIDMLGNSIRVCPDELWDTPILYWYNAYHCIFHLDYYLSEPEGFHPPAPFTLSEFDPDGEMPERIYSKEELLTYLSFCRQKCHDVIMALTEETALKNWTNPYRSYPMIEMLLYNMRHVQHHAAQLNLLLRQHGCEPPRWISRA